MSRQEDQALLEAVKTHRERLLAAFLFGSLGRRRVASTLLNRLLVGLVLAAIACAVCAGVAFTMNLLHQQGTSPSPTPTPTSERRPAAPASGQEGSAL